MNPVDARDGAEGDPVGSANLILRPSSAEIVFDDISLQRLWLATQERPWSSLAILAADEGISTVGFAHTLAKVAWFHRGQPTCVFDLRDLTLRLVEHQLREVAAQIDQGDLAFIALRSIAENPTSRAVARAADAVLLCVGLGETRAAAARRTLQEIGRERFLGSVVFRSSHHGSRARRSSSMK